MENKYGKHVESSPSNLDDDVEICMGEGRSFKE